MFLGLSVLILWIPLSPEHLLLGLIIAAVISQSRLSLQLISWIIMNHEPVIVLLITGRFKNDEDLIAAVIPLKPYNHLCY